MGGCYRLSDLPIVIILVAFPPSFSHPMRWRVGAVVDYIMTHFSPSCYFYPSRVFDFDFNIEFVRYDIYEIVKSLLF